RGNAGWTGSEAEGAFDEITAAVCMVLHCAAVCCDVGGSRSGSKSELPSAARQFSGAKSAGPSGTRGTLAVLVGRGFDAARRCQRMDCGQHESAAHDVRPGVD